MEIDEKLKKRLYARVDYTIADLKDAHYGACDMFHHSSDGWTTDGLGVRKIYADPDSGLHRETDFVFVLNDRCQYERCDVEVPVNVRLTDSFLHFALRTVNEITDIIISANDTSYSRFVPRREGFTMHIVLPADASRKEYAAMTKTGRWKKPEAAETMF